MGGSSSKVEHRDDKPADQVESSSAVQILEHLMEDLASGYSLWKIS